MHTHIGIILTKKDGELYVTIKYAPNFTKPFNN